MSDRGKDEFFVPFFFGVVVGVLASIIVALGMIVSRL